MKPNIGWLFYRDYFNNYLGDKAGYNDGRSTATNLDWRYVTTALTSDQEKALKANNEALLEYKNKRILGSQFKAYGSPMLDLVGEGVASCEHTFSLKTTYPGLLAGSGNQHAINAEGEFKLGFYFDHTSGIPVLPGSSVKGVLRSVFPNSGEDAPGIEERREFAKWLLNRVNLNLEVGDRLELNDLDIDALEYDIFEGKRKKTGKPGEWEYHISMGKRDIFFDAFISSGGKGDHFLEKDFITPHINRDYPELSPFSNPNPLQFLKVQPEVCFTFQFRLFPSQIGDVTVNPNFKKELFRQILLQVGIGAKTNVGYGQFVDPDQKVKAGGGILEKQTGEPEEYKGRLRVNEKLEAQVIDPENKKGRVIVNGENYEVEIQGRCQEEKGELINAKINALRKDRISHIGYLGPKRQKP